MDNVDRHRCPSGPSVRRGDSGSHRGNERRRGHRRCRVVFSFVDRRCDHGCSRRVDRIAPRACSGVGRAAGANRRRDVADRIVDGDHLRDAALHPRQLRRPVHRSRLLLGRDEHRSRSDPAGRRLSRARAVDRIRALHAFAFDARSICRCLRDDHVDRDGDALVSNHPRLLRSHRPAIARRHRHRRGADRNDIHSGGRGEFGDAARECCRHERHRCRLRGDAASTACVQSRVAARDRCRICRRQRQSGVARRWCHTATASRSAFPSGAARHVSVGAESRSCVLSAGAEVADPRARAECGER